MAPQEAMTNFNARFHTTWKRIQTAICSPADLAFMFYLKSLNAKILLMIQSLGGNTLSDVYNIIVKAENNLIDTKNLFPHFVMPIFVELSALAQEIASTIEYAPS